MRLALIPATMLAFAFAVPAFAQNSNTMGTTASGAGKAQLDANDQQYLRHTARGADYELAISQLALQKSQSSDVKTYAQQIVSDHAKANSQLQQVASQNGMQLPTDMTAEQQAEYKRLQGLSGRAFDQAYIGDVKSINQQDASQFRTETAALSNKQLKSVAQEMHQTDQLHAQAAQNLKP